MFLRLCSRAPRMERYLLSMTAPARRTPALKWPRRLAGGSAPDDRIDRDIFVEIRPMDAFADQPPIAAFGGRRLVAPWIPARRDRDRSPVRKSEAERNRGCLDRDGVEERSLSGRRNHSMSPRGRPGSGHPSEERDATNDPRT